MTKNAVTIRLDGDEIPLESFAEAVSGWVDQLAALRSELKPNARIDWVVSDLKAGSAICTILGRPEEGTSTDDIEDVVSGYEDEWDAFKNGLPSRHSYDVQASTRKIASILNGRVTAIRTAVSGGKEIVISPQERVGAYKITKGFTSFGAVTGKVQTISTRYTHHFLLYDVDDDHKITCYLREGSEDIMREMWGKTAIVEGELYRDSKTGRVVTVRDITVVEAAPSHGGWRDAIGIAPGGANAINPEEAIRRARSG
ncbi:MAG TPA: hypothetical protein VM008_12880 [Phycisphaerae bacterium]|nr:hypothetical protein [Phycisphaerae bacterium]